MIQGLNASRGRRFFLSPNCQNWFWGPPSLLFKGYQGSFPGVKWQVLKLTTHLHPVPRLRMSRAIPLLPLYATMVWIGKNSLFKQIVCIKIEKHFNNWLCARK
jgi:hypothetical protein